MRFIAGAAFCVTVPVSMLFAGVMADGQTVIYDGSISHENNRAVFAIAGRSPSGRLLITSSGGDVAAGIALGRWVARNHMVVEVQGHCLSSCANYVFTAGARKIIRPGAIVAWHGNYHHLKQTGLWQDEIEPRMRRRGETREVATRFIQEQVAGLVALEQRFFREIGIDEKLCWIGKLPPYRVPNYYFLSKQDMQRFGLSALEVPQNYETTDVSGLDEDVRLIRLVPRP